MRHPDACVTPPVKVQFPCKLEDPAALEMSMMMPTPQPALKYDVEVTKDGRIEVPVPFPVGAKVTVFVVEQADDRFDDLVAASQSSLGFWDNPFDDEDWNNA